MVTKPKKVAAPAAAAATPATPAPAAASDTKTPAPTVDASATAPAAPARADEFPGEAVENLIAMGFPEAEVRACLRASNGNPDIAVEFLTNGIPDGMQQAAALASGGAASSSPAASGGGTLQALRSHPQFDDLRRLVQSNPQMLQQVLTQIGQQQPELLQEINGNQAQFLAMMNEPIVAAAPGSGGASSPGGGAGAGGGEGGFPAGMMEGIGNPAQMAQMIQSMSPEELNQMAQMMGLSPDQLRTTAQMIGQMPPEQLSQFMMQAMGGGGAEGMMGGGGGGGEGGQQVLRLTEEEMAAVDRLAEMGFDRSEAAQAFLACDKNEALAANLLMDGGFGFGPDDSGNGGGSGNNNGEGDNDGDDMYD
jgi:UV excision repair protein RAD23